MKVLLVGVGGVGEALAVLAKDKAWIEQLVLCDYNVDRAKEVQAKIGDPARMPVEFIDAGNKSRSWPWPVSTRWTSSITRSTRCSMRPSSTRPTRPAATTWTWP